MKRFFLSILIITSLSLFPKKGMAQELFCDVQVNAGQIQGSVTRIFESMQTDIRDFMNNRAWTGDRYRDEEKIRCNILITLAERVGNNGYTGTIQVTSTRPVYNSDYESPMMNIRDQEFSFTYEENTILEFSPDQFRSNLTSVLAYYAYLIIAYDYDSFSLKGGDEYFNLCRQIVNNAQNAPGGGWRAFDSDKNRYWIIDNMLAGNFISMRDAIYKYHRQGLDKMYDSVIEGRTNITQALELIRKVHQAKPLAYATQVFFQAKADEIVNIYKTAPDQEKERVFGILSQIDPGNLSKYNALKK